MTRLDHALDHARRKLLVFPVYPIRHGTCACPERERCPHPGKHPLGPLAPHGRDDATREEKSIGQWWGRRWADANIGIATGPESGVVALDVDPRHGGDETLTKLEAQHGALPLTWETVTGSGGRHLLFRYPTEGLASRNGALGPGLDLKAAGGYIVAPGSGHLSGGVYAWEVTHHPDEVPLADAPAWFLAAARTQSPTNGGATRGRVTIPDMIPEGQRNERLYQLARSLHAQGMKAGAVLAALLQVNTDQCSPPLPDAEVADLVEHAMTQPDRPDFAAAPSEAPHLTDSGNAQRFAGQHGARVRYVHPQHRWLCWVGPRWEPDAEGRVLALAKQTGRSVYEEAARADDPDKRKHLARWAAYSESEPACRRMLTLAQSEPGIPALPDALDREPYVLNAINGIVNLRDGRLGPHDPARLLTKLAPVVYDPDAKCPRFLRFMGQMFAGRGTLIDFMQRAIGYALMGDPCEQVVLLWHGDGANGKSTLLKVLHAVLGDYVVASPSETFLTRREAGIPNDVARLHKARIVTATELEGGKRLAEAFIKAATGGDLLTARFLHAEWFSFAPTFVPILVFNRRPRITGRDHAIWRRVLLVPFIVTIPEAEQDRHLAERLISDEGAGILTWLVQGGLAWQRDGLRVPDEVRTATREYRQEEDVLAPFLVEACILDPEARIGVGELYGAYARWADEGRERAALNRADFRAALLTHDGIGSERTKSARTWTGIRLRTPADPEPADEPESVREGVAPW